MFFSLQNVTKYHLNDIAKLKKNSREKTLDIQELRYNIPDYLTVYKRFVAMTTMSIAELLIHKKA